MKWQNARGAPIPGDWLLEAVTRSYEVVTHVRVGQDLTPFQVRTVPLLVWLMRNP